jgi:hypothetical protein
VRQPSCVQAREELSEELRVGGDKRIYVTFEWCSH